MRGDGRIPRERWRRAHALCGAVTLACALSATAAPAAEPGGMSTEPMDMTMEELLTTEITTASRAAQTMSEAPAAVTVVTRSDIRRYGYRTLSQALASVPGFYMTDDRGYSYVGVRGVGIPTDYNIRILILLNGLPLNDKYYGAALTEFTPDMLDAIERIEVVKGPSSTLYGSNALFAIVNVITRRGADVDGAVVSAEAGTGPLGRGVVTFGDAYANGLDAFVSGHFEASGGERHLSFGSGGEARHADAHRLASAYGGARYGDFFAQLWYADRKKELPTGQWGTIVGDDRSTTSDGWYLGELRWEHELSGDKKLMVRTYYQDYPYEGVYQFDDPDFTKSRERTADRWLGTETQLNWKLAERHVLTVGAVYEHHWTRLRGRYEDSNGDASFVYPGTDDRFSYWGIYAQDEIRILPTVRLTLGLRYDQYPDFDIDRVSPRGALVWSPAKATTLKFLYGRAFRAPSHYERTYGIGSGLGPSLESLDVETISTYELVLEQVLPSSVFGRLSLFYNDVEDLIVQVDDDPVIFANVLNVRTTGIEAELSKRFACGLAGFVNATWQDSHFSDGDALNSPEWLANAGVHVPIIGDKLAFSVRESFVSERPTRVAGEETDHAFTTDLTLTSEQALTGWSFNLGLLNVFDEHYSVPSGTDGTLDRIPQRGRTVLFRATAEF